MTGAILLGVLGWASAVGAQSTSRPGGDGPPKLEEVRIFLVLKNGNRLIGDLEGYDAHVVRVRDKAGRIQTGRWEEFQPVGAYNLQKRLTNPNSAEVNYRLGVYCLTNRLNDEAQLHFQKARRLDPTYAERIKTACTGRLITKPDLAVALNDPKELEEVERSGAGGVPESPRFERPTEVVKYQAFTVAQQTAAMEKIRGFRDEVNGKLSTQLRQVEAKHFMIFTTWDPKEDRALAEMFDSIYERLCRQFDIPTTENVYLGKLPVFAWVTRDEFARFAKEIQKMDVRPTAMAYVTANRSGFQWMNLYQYSNRLLLEKILSHECVHTFVNRYRSNLPLEGWLNEGLAEVMSGTMVPRAGTLERSRKVVAAQIRQIDVKALLRGGYGSPAPQLYPPSTTLVDYLMRRDPAKFLTMIDKIKAGGATEASLKAAYGIDYDGLADAWRRWVDDGYSKL